MDSISEQINKIASISGTDISRFYNTPIYSLLERRKTACMQYIDANTEEDKKLLSEMIEYCNNEILKYFGLWKQN